MSPHDNSNEGGPNFLVYSVVAPRKDGLLASEITLPLCRLSPAHGVQRFLWFTASDLVGSLLMPTHAVGTKVGL